MPTTLRVFSHLRCLEQQRQRNTGPLTLQVFHKGAIAIRIAHSSDDTTASSFGFALDYWLNLLLKRSPAGYFALSEVPTLAPALL